MTTLFNFLSGYPHALNRACGQHSGWNRTYFRALGAYINILITVISQVLTLMILHDWRTLHYQKTFVELIRKPISLTCNFTSMAHFVFMYQRYTECFYVGISLATHSWAIMRKQFHCLGDEWTRTLSQPSMRSTQCGPRKSKLTLENPRNPQGETWHTHNLEIVLSSPHYTMAWREVRNVIHRKHELNWKPIC